MHLGALQYLLIQQFLQRCQLQTGGEDLHGLLQFCHGGQTGGDADIAVVGVLSVGEGCAGIGHGDTDSRPA